MRVMLIRVHLYRMNKQQNRIQGKGTGGGGGVCLFAMDRSFKMLGRERKDRQNKKNEKETENKINRQGNQGKG